MIRWTKGKENPDRAYRAELIGDASDFEDTDGAASWYLEMICDSWRPDAGPISHNGGSGRVMIEISSRSLPTNLDYCREYLRALLAELDKE